MLFIAQTRIMMYHAVKCESKQCMGKSNIASERIFYTTSCSCLHRANNNIFRLLTFLHSIVINFNHIFFFDSRPFFISATVDVRSYCQRVLLFDYERIPFSLIRIVGNVVANGLENYDYQQRVQFIWN